MRLKFPLDLLSRFEPPSTLVELAKLDAAESAVVSCYLNTRAGRSTCLSFLNRKAASIRNALHGVARFNFDTAVEMIRLTLDREIPNDVQGLAIFARGASDARHLTLVRTCAPLDNRLVHSRTPEILPLLALHQREPACNLLVLHDGGFELLENGLGAMPKLICRGGRDALEGRAAASVAVSASASWNVPFTEDGLWQLRKALACSELPLLLVGDTASLGEAADWLPDQATDRLVGCVDVSADDADQRPLEEIARSRLGEMYRDASQRLAVAVASGAASGSAAVGYRAVLDALRNDEGEVLVIGDWDQPGLGLPWEVEVELCSEALRRQIRVVLAENLQLRQVGGVACLLREQLSRTDHRAIGGRAA